MIGSGIALTGVNISLDGFQSLLFWMIGSGPFETGWKVSRNARVSILVVLDDWFGANEQELR